MYCCLHGRLTVLRSLLYQCYNHCTEDVTHKLTVLSDLRIYYLSLRLLIGLTTKHQVKIDNYPKILQISLHLYPMFNYLM